MTTRTDRPQDPIAEYQLASYYDNTSILLADNTSDSPKSILNAKNQDTPKISSPESQLNKTLRCATTFPVPVAKELANSALADIGKKMANTDAALREALSNTDMNGIKDNVVTLQKNMASPLDPSTPQS